MNIHNQFTFTHFVVFSIILLIVNFLIFKFKKRDGREFLNCKLVLLAFISTFLGLFYSEISHSNDWMVKTYGFPKCFYLTKKPSEEPICVEFFIQEFKYFNFLQNFTLFFLVLNLIKIIFKKSLK